MAVRERYGEHALVESMAVRQRRPAVIRVVVGALAEDRNGRDLGGWRIRIADHGRRADLASDGQCRQQQPDQVECAAQPPQ